MTSESFKWILFLVLSRFVESFLFPAGPQSVASPALLLGTEVIKFIICLINLKFIRRQLVTPFDEDVSYVFPPTKSLIGVAVISVAQSYLSLFLHLRSSASISYIFEALNVLTTAAVWTFVFKNPVSMSQWIVIGIQCAGVSIMEMEHCAESWSLTNLPGWIILLFVLNCVLQSLIFSSIGKWGSDIQGGDSNAGNKRQPQIFELALRYTTISVGVNLLTTLGYEVIAALNVALFGFRSWKTGHDSGFVIQLAFMLVKGVCGVLCFSSLARMDPVFVDLSFGLVLALPVIMGHVITYFSSAHIISFAASLVIFSSVFLYALEGTKVPITTSSLSESDKMYSSETAHGPRRKKVVLFAVLVFGGLCLASHIGATRHLWDHSKSMYDAVVRTTSSSPTLSKSAKFKIGRKERRALLKQKIREHFSDTLVILHFNTYRYDTNIDVWDEVYGPYFPNRVIYGPGTWEQPENAFRNYSRMGEVFPYGDFASGGMPGYYAYLAHYLAIKHNPVGYRGYLWVHFDVFMNISTLVRFNKDRVWGPAWQCKWQERGLEEECGGWHWCGDSGLKACRDTLIQLQTFLPQWTGKAAPSLYEKCEAYASDALYIPAVKKDLFLKLAETFLKNRAFLEIAVPQISRLMNSTESPNEQWIYDFHIDMNRIMEREKDGGTCGHPELHYTDMGHAMNLKDAEEVRKMKQVINRDVERLGDYLLP